MEFPDRILEELDEAQRQVAFHGAGPLLVVAGAGSGKTRAIAARIVRLLRDGVAPLRIVGITFTNRAAAEMRERVRRSVFPSSLPRLGTFHAFGAALLRRFASRAGIPPGFAICDERDRLDRIRQVLRDRNLDERRFPPAVFAAVIERAKREGTDPETAAMHTGWAFPGKAGEVARDYEEALRAAGSVDFADLIRLPLRLFREVPGLLEEVRGEVRHLLVDEFQDVDRAQADLARAIALGAESFCAVGDEDQSIYGWRGGSAGPMLSFERDFPGARVVRLETNYRSRAAILAAAGQVIGRNRERREKRIVPAREGGQTPTVRGAPDPDGEAREVARGIGEELRRGTAPGRIAVFYRVNAQSRALEDALRERGIGYLLRGALSFYARAAVRDALAYPKWFLNPEDLVSLRRLLRAPRRGVGDAALARARESSRGEGRPVSEALARIPGLVPLFRQRREWLRALPERDAGEALRELLAGAGYLPHLELRCREEERLSKAGGPSDDLENVRELIRLAGATEGKGEQAIRLFLERVSLSGSEDGDDDREAVTLMTMHTAKGLEFDAVYLVGLEEGLLPHARAGTEREVEEERRLFYVGLTRARERATISFARRRSVHGSFRPALPSRFLWEIPGSLLRWEDAPPELLRGEEGMGGRSPVADRGARPAVPRAHSPPGGAGARPGGGPGDPSGSRRRRVRHPVFGEGFLESEEGEGGDRKIVAIFPGHGRKRILVRAVPMEFPE